MAIGFSLAEDMPDSDEKPAGDGDCSLVGANASLQTLKLGFPVGVSVSGAPGSFYQDPTQLLATGLGDATCAVFIPAGVDGGAQPSVADKFLGMREAGDIADSGKHSEGGDQPETGELEQKWDLICPGL